jgi:hypothetical protein
MKPPPLMLGAVLLFWGWRTNMLWVGLIAGGLLEVSHLVRGRWAFTDKEFNRLWDICTVLFLGLAVYLRFSEDISSAAYKFFEWMPLVFYPMVLGYTYSVRDAVPMKAFSWLLRRKGAQGADRPVAFGWLYAIVCLVAAGATNGDDIGFFAGSAALIGWGLWVIRPRRLTTVAWCILFLSIAGVAYYGQSRMLEVQAYFENKVSELIVKFGARRDFDPTQSQTAMGEIGALKQSSRVVLKLKAEQGAVPERILECTYGRLDRTTWRGGNARTFDSVAVEPDTTTWNLVSNAPVRAAVRIIQRVNRKDAFLAVPSGTKQLRELTAGAVETNRLGVIRVRDNPGLLNFVARYGRNDMEAFLNPRGEDADNVEAIRQIAEELNIDHLSDREKLPAIVNFFQRNFRYTTYQQARDRGLHRRSPLSYFLLNSRAGHCEYFASATVLLLRHYGLPSRYATGYAVQELAREEDAYIIRERHGHAWAMVYLDGEWVEVDSTPSGWAEAEATEFSGFQDIKDAWGRFLFGFLEWRWLGDWSFIRLAAPWMVIPLAGFLIWRIFGRTMSRQAPPIRATETWPGADSEFFQLERRLAKTGFGRLNEETTAAWLQRLRQDQPQLSDSLPNLIRLHQKYRFGGEGILPAERDELRSAVRQCLARV